MIHWSWFEPYLMYLGGLVLFDSWRLLRVRRIWGSLVASVLVLLLVIVLLPQDKEITDLSAYLLGGLMFTWFGAYLYSFVTLAKMATRIKKLVTRAELAADWGGELVVQDGRGYRTPRENLEELLPLVEPIGHAPGHPEITPAWIREQLTLAEEKSAIVAALLIEAPTTLPIAKPKWWLPSDL